MVQYLDSMQVRGARAEVEKDSDFVISRTRASAARKAENWGQEALRLQYISQDTLTYRNNRREHALSIAWALFIRLIMSSVILS